MRPGMGDGPSPDRDPSCGEKVEFVKDAAGDGLGEASLLLLVITPLATHRA